MRGREFEAAPGKDLEALGVESEIHPSHKLRLCSVYFAPAGGLAAERQRVRKQAPERLLTKKDGVAYSEKFIYSVIEAAKRKGQD